MPRHQLGVRQIAFLVCLLGLIAGAASAAESVLTATVESTLPTAKTQIRQLAFDGDEKTFFESSQNVTEKDHFTISFDSPIALKSVAVATGRPDGTNRLDSGELQVSVDGKKFDKLSELSDGQAKADGKGKKIKAIRLAATKDLAHPLAVREWTIQSEPAVPTFKYPVEFALDTTNAPDMKDWLEKVAIACEKAYPMLNEELKSDGFKPPLVIYMALKSDYNGVAATGGDHIKGSVKYFKAHEADVGAFVHETVHAVQQYHSRSNPGWLVEGIADYVRWVKWEQPGKLRPITADKAKYDASYQTTARFLAFVVDKYDPKLILKLNQAMREGKYNEELFEDYTGKTVQELGAEWQESLRKTPLGAAPAKKAEPAKVTEANEPAVKESTVADSTAKEQTAKDSTAKELTAEEWAHQIQTDLVAGMRGDRKKAIEEFEKSVTEFTAKYPTSAYVWNFKAVGAQLTLMTNGNREATSKQVLETVTSVLSSKDAPDSAKKQALATAKSLFSNMGAGEDEEQALAKFEPYTKSEIEGIAAAAKSRADEIKKLLELKSQPLEMKFTAVDGSEFDIEKYRGKVVLIDFWATWCGPCIAELPHVKDAYEKLHDKGFEIVGISFDHEGDKEKLTKFVADKQMPWPQFLDATSIYGHKYGIHGIPTMWLIGKDGKIATFQGRGNLEEKVEKLLAK